MIQEESTPLGRGLDLRLLGRLLRYLLPYTPWVLLTLLFIFVGALARQAGPLLTKFAVDDHFLPGIEDGFGSLVLIYVGLLALQFALGYGETWATNMVGQWAMRDVRMEMFSHLQRLPLRFFDRTPVGRLMARNTSDVDALNELFTDGLVALVSDVVTVVTILGMIFYMDLRMGLLACLCLPLSFVATVWLQRMTYGAMQEARTRFASFAASLQEAISGMEVVQLFGSEDRRSRSFAHSNGHYVKARLLASRYHSAYFPSMEMWGGLLLALTLWYGTGQITRQQMEWGVLVAMLQYVPRFFMPLRDIAERYATVQTAMASSERIFELIDTEAETTGSHRAPQQVQGRIEFRNVWFTYGDDVSEDAEWILRDVSFAVEPGQSLAVVGATGAGKSTVVSLLCRFYQVQRGAVLVDGIDVKQWDARDLRRRIGLVHQDVFLFAGTVGDNISLGDPDLSMQRIEAAARDTNADRFISRLPQGYDQPVGERGVSLSSGQRQLLSFARVLAADPEILVLDEATANVDTETEMWIQEGVDRLMRQRTSLVIAHRLSTVRTADTILVLHHGQVREMGSHDELLARNGLYHRLYQLQYSGESA
ncbi:MAG: ABC transporter ATP-binding protein [Candidatus Latescibacteria bacterium]|jgi:ATP-binding cassette subfamily B protein|nr:antibiotic ABC transporter ATP-binding protein [Gemmatimonadaceae bacterium]MDP6016332.1 ABC transporter ATP-binding protein [Candidatus Latescibacterota bacterium]MDP7449768.1 ABC transporter ATP-binding protein [Candidatus Latescibacterota bacterium]HJP29631.1 ABC transporter ATP-binding protein [Candidatus Latescibacterota bacterium]